MSDPLWSEMWRRVDFVLCVAVGIIALVATVATTDAMVGKWPRAAIFLLGLMSFSKARLLWKGLSDSRDPDQPPAPPRGD
jgi:hypothetical protein